MSARPWREQTGGTAVTVGSSIVMCARVAGTPHSTAAANLRQLADGDDGHGAFYLRRMAHFAADRIDQLEEEVALAAAGLGERARVSGRMRAGVAAALVVAVAVGALIGWGATRGAYSCHSYDDGAYTCARR